jgi:hypothetical protein
MNGLLTVLCGGGGGGGWVGVVVSDGWWGSRPANDRVGLLHANLLVGISFGWWVPKHNAWAAGRLRRRGVVRVGGPVRCRGSLPPFER